MHAEIFGREEDRSPQPPQRGGWLRYALSFFMAAAVWVTGDKLGNGYLMIFALAVAGSTACIILVRAIDARKRRRNNL
ncbi:MAG: hypothetical protein FVQ81_11640 [Candidatus Glassbacteria bacterium]|nr:hypothetical protein [Candidatus Glassbacteria bacterium]